MNDQSPSDELIAHVKASEKLCLTPYVDLAGHTTWGYGHKGKPGELVPQRISEEDADALLEADLHVAGAAVREHVTVDMTQSEYDGFADFTFNLGAGALAGSTMLRLFNDHDSKGAAAECLKWDHAHVRGHLVEENGLKIRRAWDAARIDLADSAEDVEKESEFSSLEFPSIDPNAPVPGTDPVEPTQAELDAIASQIKPEGAV